MIMSNTDNLDHPIKIVGIVGSLRPTSYTREVVKLALEGAAELGAVTELLDLRDYHLVFPFEVDKDQTPDDVQRLRSKVKQADGIILGTPEYHGSFSGVLKNAIDLMSFEEFQGKMIGLVGVGGGALGAINALNGLRAIGRQLHAWVVPQQASIPNVSSAFDGTKLRNEKLTERVKDVGRQVTRFTFLHTSKEIETFLNEWEQAPNNPGGSR